MENHVVFTSIGVGPRERKMGLWLRRRGWRVTLLTALEDSEPETCFDKVVYLDRLSEFVSVARELKARVYHAFCKVNDYRIAHALLANGVGPLVCDPYDLINTAWQDGCAKPDWVTTNGALELECVRHAHALCARDMLPRGLKAAKLLLAGQPVLYFPEYIWGGLPRMPKLRHADGKLHFVYSGTMPQLWEFKEFIDGYSELGHSIDFYPHYNPKTFGPFEHAYAQYLEIAARNPLIRVHRPIFGERLITEISQYDIMFNFSPTIHGVYERYNPVAANRWYSNKFADSVEADLFYVANPGQLTSQLGARLGMGMGVGIEKTRDRAFWEDIKSRLDTIDFEHARRRWNHERNIDRLVHFYEKLSS